MYLSQGPCDRLIRHWYIYIPRLRHSIISGNKLCSYLYNDIMNNDENNWRRHFNSIRVRRFIWSVRTTFFSISFSSFSIFVCQVFAHTQTHWYLHAIKWNIRQHLKYGELFAMIAGTQTHSDINLLAVSLFFSCSLRTGYCTHWRICVAIPIWFSGNKLIPRK